MSVIIIVAGDDDESPGDIGSSTDGTIKPVLMSSGEPFVVPIIYQRPNPDYSSPEHGEQTGHYCDRCGSYGIYWDGIRRQEVFICTHCKRIYDVVPKEGCGCDR